MYGPDGSPQTADPALLRRSRYQNPREPNQANAPCPSGVVQGDEPYIESRDSDDALHSTAFPGQGPSSVAHAHPHTAQSFIQGQNVLATVPLTQPFESFAGNEASYYWPQSTYNSSEAYPSQPVHFLPSHGAEWYDSTSYGGNAMSAESSRMYQGVAATHQVPLPFDINSAQMSDQSLGSPFSNVSFLTPGWDLLGSMSLPNSVSTGTRSWDMIADPRMNTVLSPRQLEAAIRNIPAASDHSSPASRHLSSGQATSSDIFSSTVNQMPIDHHPFMASDYLVDSEETTYTHGSPGTLHVTPGISAEVEPGIAKAITGVDHNVVQTLIPAIKRKYDEEKKTKVNETRARSSCIWCQLQKKECEFTQDSDDCDACLKHRSNDSPKKIWDLPCVRVQLTDALVYRDGSIRFPAGVDMGRRWNNKASKTIRLSFPVGAFPGTQGIGRGPFIEIQCRGFQRNNVDILSRQYASPSGTKIVEFPPFAVANKAGAKKALEALVNNNLAYFVSVLKINSHALHQNTFDEAMRQAPESSLIDGTLRIAVIARLISKSFGIIGTETLGIPLSNDPSSPYYGRIPIPPMLDAQLDEIWRDILYKQKKKTLAELKRKVLSKKRRQWLETFLAIFILLQTLEFSYQHQIHQLERHRKAHPSGIPDFQTAGMLEKWCQSAKNLLWHFEVVCEGTIPFQPGWVSPENLQLGSLDEPSTAYLQELLRLIGDYRTELLDAIKRGAGTPLHWIALLLIPKQI